MRGKNLSSLVVAALVSSLFLGCSGRDGETLDSPMVASDAPIATSGDLYTLVNLHVDPKGNRVFSTNYQSPILLPLCTRVRISEQSGKVVRFTAVDQGIEYTYLRSKHLRAPFSDHLAQVFGSQCVSSRVAAMNEIDRRGIEEGRALPGLSKDAVILAMGYPPDHATTSLAADRWTYWRNRVARMIVHFSDGVVSHVQ